MASSQFVHPSSMATSTSRRRQLPQWMRDTKDFFIADPFSFIFGGLGVLASLIGFAIGVLLIVAGLGLQPISLVTDIYYGTWPPPPPETGGEVNGFYGPGAFLAWLISGSYMTATYLLDGWSSSDTDTHSEVPDMISFLATAAYAAIAVLDSILRFAKGQHIETDVQLRAAVTVCRYAVLLSGLSLFARAKRSRARLRWRAVLLACTIPLAIGEVQHCGASVHLHRALVPVCLFLVSLMGDVEGRWFVFVVLSTLDGLILVVASGGLDQVNFFCFDANDKPRPRTIAASWPRSAVPWSDLDQVAALLASLLVLGYSLLTRYTEVLDTIEDWYDDAKFAIAQRWR